MYLCDGNRSVKAAFMETVTEGATQNPVGSVSLVLDTAPAVVLPQAISADGARYSDASEALVFWTKGSGALVLQNGIEGLYTNCIVVKENVGGLSQVYHDGAVGFTVRYPVGFMMVATHTYNGLGTKKGIVGVKFTIPAATATGTNLSADSYLSVEHMGTSTTLCDASAFLFPGTYASTTELVVGDMTYSFASSTDAAAGNRYEEMVYAIPGSSPCIGVRSFVHYTALENYATGTVVAFDRSALEKNFAAIRSSLTYVPRIAPAVATTTTATTTATTSTTTVQEPILQL
jgi:membrane-bound inhibitor of C-type lysozyme